MTSFEIEELHFNAQSLKTWAPLDDRHRNWPVVYTLDGPGEVYVGESLNAAGRFKQHLETSKKRLRRARVVVDPTFNKSVCLDLESYLIRLFAGDGKYKVLNRNHGITDAEYYGRQDYRKAFDRIFEELKERGAFSRSVQEIENTDLFKLSPFKALTSDQAIAVEDILSGLFDDLEKEVSSRLVIQGDPGTGKTVVAIYLIKLLTDIQNADLSNPVDGDSILSEFFVEGYPQLLTGFRIGLVVPQQSLRKSIQNVFRKTPGLTPSMVMTPFEAAQAGTRFDLLIVDEAHRLSQRASLASGAVNALFPKINVKLFGHDDLGLTQVDWINEVSRHQIYLVDAAQAVRPADVPRQVLDDLTATAKAAHRHYPLTMQMRVQAGSDYVGYIRGILDGAPVEPRTFPGYDLRFFDDLAEMLTAVAEKNAEVGLARTVAGYAWPWRSRKDPTALDITIGECHLRWNSTDVDWVNSPKSTEEVGSIHTIQGYDLNVAAVIIGPDLRFDTATGRIRFDRANYHDAKGMQNNPNRRITYTDEDVLQFVKNIYAVLLTRGILGTYVYVCDPPLREYLRRYL
ncbi:DNA/RNA helicase domain-containing protein [Kineococcus sp. SYSU DK018]|uniref:DNA/RNA helicase domain-containing protein n=1 Tax=Kineococcus sp. SYSU DK018 TaxID=3383139 RepID=UPI003D7ECADF